MRIAWALALLAVAGCSTVTSQPEPSAPLASNPIIPCTDPRPELCTMQYAPACASLAKGGFWTYASACNACADSAVVGYQNGPCSE
jgi:hypothetical protein